jgi:hypothetical protein
VGATLPTGLEDLRVKKSRRGLLNHAGRGHLNQRFARLLGSSTGLRRPNRGEGLLNPMGTLEYIGGHWRTLEYVGEWRRV